MSLVKRGKFWQYDFWYKKERFRGSTDQTNKNEARTVEAKIKSDLALRRHGIGPQKISPLLKDFLEGSFLQHVDNYAKTIRTKVLHRNNVKRLLEYRSWLDHRLPEIDSEVILGYSTARCRHVEIATANGELATLRKALRLAFELGFLTKQPVVRLLPGANGPRDFVVSSELEQAYLDVAPYPLRQAAILIRDLGLRPEECCRAKKTDIANDALTVRPTTSAKDTVKTKNAVRALLLTERARDVIQLLSRLNPDSEWLFPGLKPGQHYGRQSLDNAHNRLRAAQGWPEAFVLHSLRHTFATRLADSGANQYEIMAAMGHSDIRMSAKYIHPDASSLSRAMTRKEMLDRMNRGETVPTDFTTVIRK